jgi:hypothetical protein
VLALIIGHLSVFDTENAIIPAAIFLKKFSIHYSSKFEWSSTYSSGIVDIDKMATVVKYPYVCDVAHIHRKFY